MIEPRAGRGRLGICGEVRVLGELLSLPHTGYAAGAGQAVYKDKSVC